MSQEIEIEDMNTQLAIYLDGVLIPIHSFDWEINTPETRVHHLHQSNRATFSQPIEIEISFRLYEIGKERESLTVLLYQLQRSFFSVVMTEYDGNQWVYNSLGFDKCKIVQNRGSYSRERPPEDVVRAICLEFNINNALAFGSQ